MQGWHEPSNIPDANEGRVRGAERVEVSVAEVDNEPTIGSASISQYARYRGTWLPLRRRSKLEVRRAAEQPRLMNFNPMIKLP